MILCQCPAEPRFPGAQCPDPVGQEDGLCDWCRTIDCPTLTPENMPERQARAIAASVGQVPF